MNKISEIRKAVLERGEVLLDTDSFNQLQCEWIKRANDDYFYKNSHVK